MTSGLKFAVFTSLCISHAFSGNVITTTTGQVKGVSLRELNVEAFLSIPYAEPPVGELRFQRPLPKKPWSDVYIADHLPPSCMQNNSGNYYEPSSETPMSEDCLFLNMWVPHSVDERLKAIMVFIHGGAHTLGSSNMKLYDGTHLARKGDVIVVTLNFRLGTLGFLFLEGGEVNGNMGLFDQVMGIEWIKANAKAFGGDPDRITLFGESSGSACIGSFMLSPLTRRLFRRAIMQSGASVHPMNYYNNARVSAASKKIARLSGCLKKDETDDTPADVVSCMRNLPAAAVTGVEGKLKTDPIQVTMRTHGDIVPDHIPRLLSRANFSSDMELLIGNNEAEGAFFLVVAAPDYFREGQITLSSKMARNLIRVVLKAIGAGQQSDETSRYYVDRFGNGTSDSYLQAFGAVLGDYFIDCGAYFHAEVLSSKIPVYYYVMKNRPASTPFGKWVKMTHFDELQYVFGNPLFEELTPEEEAFSDKVIKRWTAFAKTGNPNVPGEVEWPRFQPDGTNYMVLSKRDTVHNGRPDDGRCEVWRKKFEVNEEGFKQ